MNFRRKNRGRNDNPFINEMFLKCLLFLKYFELTGCRMLHCDVCGIGVIYNKCVKF